MPPVWRIESEVGIVYAERGEMMVGYLMATTLMLALKLLVRCRRPDWNMTDASWAVVEVLKGREA